jgi:hypothetical protein
VVLLTENYERGTNGNAVLVSSASYDSNSGSCTFDSTRAAHGSLAGKYVTSAGSSFSAYIGSAGTLTTEYFRGYFHLNGATPAATLFVFNALSTAAACARVGITAALKVVSQDQAGTTQTTSTSTVNASAWFRLEAKVIHSLTVGQLEVKLFNTMDSGTPDETNTSAATLNTKASADHFRFGLTTSSTFTIWLDDAGLSDSGYLGSAGTLISDPDTGAGVDGGTGPSGGTHERINVDDAVGFP